MRSEILSQEKNVVTIKVVVESEDFAAKLAKTYKDLSMNAKVPGFRKGKVSASVLELRFGKETILSETLEEMLPGILREVTTDYDLEIIEKPDVKIDVMEKGKDLELTIVFEVEPEVELADLSEITVTLPKFDMKDDSIDEAIEDLRNRNAIVEKVERASEPGNSVKASYKTVVVDEEGAEVVSHDPETQLFDLNEKNLKPAIYDALVGTTAGDEVDSEVTIEDNYQDEKLAGKTARYHFVIEEVQEKKLPELDEDFFKKVVGEPVDSLELFREKIGTQIQEHMDNEARQFAENEMAYKSVDASSVEIPESMIKRQMENIKKDQEEKKDAPELNDEELLKKATQDVKQFLVMDAYGKNLGVDILKEDFDEEFEKMAKAYNVPASTIKSAFGKNQERIEEMANSIRIRKTVAAMMEKVVVEEKSIDENSEENK